MFLPSIDIVKTKVSNDGAIRKQYKINRLVSDAMYVDPECSEEDSWDHIPKNSVTFMFGIHCPIYVSFFRMYNLKDLHNKQSTISQILIHARSKLVKGGILCFEFSNNSIMPHMQLITNTAQIQAAANSLFGLTKSNKPKKVWKVTTRRPEEMHLVVATRFDFDKSFLSSFVMLCFEKL